MKKKVKNSRPRVFFNASVILAGLKSPRGGSAKVLFWAKNGRIKGFASEIVIDEVKRKLEKLRLKKEQLETIKQSIKTTPAPESLEKKILKNC